MKSKGLGFLGGVAVLTVCTQGYSEPLRRAAKSVEGDVMAVFLVGDLKRTDSAYRQAITDMGLEDNVPEAARHPLRTLMEKIPRDTGFDESGSIAFALLSANNLFDLMNNTVVYLPASDAAALLSSLAGEGNKNDENGIRSVQFFGQTMYGVTLPTHVALAKSAQVARRARQVKKPLHERLQSHEADALDGLDAAIWVDAAAALKMFKPQIDGLVGWSLMMQMGAGEVGEDEARFTKQQVDSIVDGMSSVLVGVSVNDAGVGLRVAVSTRPDSALAKQSQQAIATEPLLRGLPRRNYLAAFGQEFHPAALRAALPGMVEPILAELKKSAVFEAEAIESMRKEVTQLIEAIRGGRGCIDHLQAGPDGRFAGTLLLDVADSREWIAVAEKFGARFGALPVPEFEHEEWDEEWDEEAADENPDKPEDHAKRDKTDAEANAGEMKPEFIRDWVSWKRDTESLEGVAVSHLFINVLRDSEPGDEDTEIVKLILGREAVTVRVTAVDGTTVAITCGGGADQMARTIRAARTKRAPLEELDEIARSVKHLPAQRSGEFFFAADRMVNFFHQVNEEVDEDEPFPFWMPRVDAPLTLGWTGGDGWSRHDLFAPMPLLAGVTEGIRMSEFSEFEDDDDGDDEEDAEGVEEVEDVPEVDPDQPE